MEQEGGFIETLGKSGWRASLWDTLDYGVGRTGFDDLKGKGEH